MAHAGLSNLAYRLVLVLLVFLRLTRFFMHIVAIGWMYVVVMMSITEATVVAGIMTFLLYGVLPVTIILYLMGSPRRKQKRAAAEKNRRESQALSESVDESSGMPDKESSGS
jgi:hypothetical protein